MKVKPTILVFNKFYLPGFRAGGPIRTLANMVARLSEDFDFKIVTLNRDVGTNSQPYADVFDEEWIKVGKANVIYLDSASITMRRLNRIVNMLSPNIVYLNSFFDPIFTQRIILARRFGFMCKIPVVLAPRGEFSEGALNLKKFKKKFYIRFSKLFKLYDGVIWHASSILEHNDILRTFVNLNINDIHIAMNLPPDEELVHIEWCPRQAGSPLRVCFLSRISPMKNLDFALRVLAEVRSNIKFSIYGPKEDFVYWDECEKIIDSLPSNIQVEYVGEVHPDNVKDTMVKHDLFFFPTRGENYGHVIREALSAGLPVLISDQTPWLSLQDEGVGWSFSLDDMGKFAEIIDEFSHIPNDTLEKIRQVCVQFSNRYVNNDVLINDNKNIFYNSISKL